MPTKIDVAGLRHKVGTYADTQRGVLIKAIDENRALTPAEQGDYDRLEEKIRAIEDTIKRADSSSERDRQLSQLMSAPVQDGLAARAAAVTLRPGEVRMLTRAERVQDVVTASLPDNAKPEEFRFGRFLKGVITGDWRGAEWERRAMGDSLDTLGGYLLPGPVSAFYVDSARNASVTLAAGVQTIPMLSETLAVPTVLSDPTASWRAEHGTITESDINFGRVTATARSLAAMCRISSELLADAPDLAGVIVQRGLTAALALEMDRAILRGAGTLEPCGIRNWPGINTTAVGGALNNDILSQGLQAVREDNEEPNAYIVNSKTAGYLDRLKAGDGQWIPPSPEVAKLRRLVTNAVPGNLGAGSNASEVTFGNFAQAALMLRAQILVELSREAGGAFERNQTLIRAIMRADVSVLRAQAFNVLTDVLTP